MKRHYLKKQESKAARLPNKETSEKEPEARTIADFSHWIGQAKQVPENPAPRFRSDDDLWN